LTLASGWCNFSYNILVLSINVFLNRKDEKSISNSVYWNLLSVGGNCQWYNRRYGVNDISQISQEQLIEALITNEKYRTAKPKSSRKIN
jgi:hypothetical protein